MKRRKAIKQVAIISMGAALLPSCQVDSLPNFANIPLEQEQYDFLNWVTEAILPKQGSPEIATPESTADFILTMINDCFDPEEEVPDYMSGLNLLKQFIEDEYGMAYTSLNKEQNVLMLTELSQSELVPESLRDFITTTKSLAVRHFTSSEYFLKTHLGFEFIPGRFNGCVPLEISI